MRSSYSLSLLLLALLAGSDLRAQTAAQATPAPGTPPTSTQPIFQARLPGGTYEVATRAMLAISTHEYLVDAAARVTELNIDTTGSLVVRFYYIEPATPQSPAGLGAATLEKAQQLVTEASERSGQDAWKKVIKSYPTTTHARTVEFRVQSKQQLNQIFEAAQEAFRLQRSRTIEIQ